MTKHNIWFYKIYHYENIHKINQLFVYKLSNWIFKQRQFIIILVLFKYVLYRFSMFLFFVVFVVRGIVRLCPKLEVF